MLSATRATLRATSRALSSHARPAVNANAQVVAFQQSRGLSNALVWRQGATASADATEGYSVQEKDEQGEMPEEYALFEQSDKADNLASEATARYEALLDISKQLKADGNVGVKDGQVFTDRKPSAEERSALARALPSELLNAERDVRRTGIAQLKAAEEVSSLVEDDSELIHDVVSHTLPYLPILDLDLFTQIISEKINARRNDSRYDDNGLPPALRDDEGHIVAFNRSEIPGANLNLEPFIIDFQYEDSTDNKEILTYVPADQDLIQTHAIAERYDSLIAKVSELGSDVKLNDVVKALANVEGTTDQEVVEATLGPVKAVIENFALSKDGRDALLSWHSDVHAVIDHLDQSLTYPADKFNDWIAQQIEEGAAGDLQQLQDRPLNSQESAGLFVLAGIIGAGVFLGQAVKRATHAGHPSSANHGHH